MLLGLTDISGGEVRVLGFNPAREPLSVKRRVGYLPDTVGFYDQLTAADNLRYTARLIGFEPAEREKRIAAALDRVGLSEVADKRVGTFSRGMRQRLGLAEILMKGAQIAILDEPTSGLDPQATAELLDIIRGFKARGRLGAAVLASARAGAERLRPRRAVQRRAHRAMGTVPELGREVLGGGYVSTSRPTAPGLPSGWRSSRASAASRRPASASCACMPTATCARRRRPRWWRCTAGCKFLGVRSRASRRSTPAISRASPTRP